jgi:thiamine pyrophosphokinase
MTRFAILLGGDMTPTPRFALPDQGCALHRRRQRHDACGKPRRGARSLGGRFRFSGLGTHPAIPRGAARKPSRGEGRDRRRHRGGRRRSGGGQREIILLGGLGGQTDHAAGLLGQSIAIARNGIQCLLTSGTEEAWPLFPAARCDLQKPPASASFPSETSSGLDLTGVKWPLENRDVPLGSTLTLSNVALGPGRDHAAGGHGIAIAYPPVAFDE